MNQALFVLLSCMAFLAFVECGGDKGEEKIYIKAQYPHHTIHKHHTEKIPDVKIVKVPVVKEVKVPEPYKVPFKVKVPFLVHQKIHVVKEHSHPVHTSEHVHHKPTHGHEHHGHEHHGHGKAHSSFDEISHSFGSHSTTDLKPIYVSHSPLTHESSHEASYEGLHHGFQPTEDAFPTYTHDFHSKLHTSVPSNVGFGSHEGRAISYEVNEKPDDSAFYSSRIAKVALSPGKMTQAYPYPLQSEPKAEFLFGFDPIASSYDLTDL